MKLVGLAASQGIARGPILWMRKPSASPISTATNVSLEVLQQRAIQSVNKLKTTVNSSTLQKLLDVQALILDDPMLWNSIATLQAQGLSQEEAIRNSIDTIADKMAMLEDPYLAARADDIRDVGEHILSHLGPGRGGVVDEIWPATNPSILVSDSLFPSDTAKIDLNHVAAIVLSQGSVTSHVAILSRSLQIPAVIVAGIQECLHDGDVITVDGFNGIVTDEDHIPIQTPKKKRAEIISRVVSTKDGHHVHVEANVGSVQDARDASQFGADGIGLLRTEFLFGGDHFPSEDEQYDILRAIAVESPKGQPITIRAADIGGDKPLSYMDLPDDPNPFLGVRALRLLSIYPHLYDSQLRAVLRLGREFPVRLMFPMIATIDDWHQCETILKRAMESLDMSICPIPVGIMLEVPSAVLLATEFAAQVQFFSIGTNDLIQYLFAADRSISALGTYYLPQNLAVLRALSGIIQAGQHTGIPVGLCGEMAGDTTYTSLLLGLGLREFSVSPRLVPQVKEQIANLSAFDCEQTYRVLVTSHPMGS